MTDKPGKDPSEEIQDLKKDLESRLEGMENRIMTSISKQLKDLGKQTREKSVGTKKTKDPKDAKGRGRGFSEEDSIAYQIQEAKKAHKEAGGGVKGLWEGAKGLIDASADVKTAKTGYKRGFDDLLASLGIKDPKIAKALNEMFGKKVSKEEQEALQEKVGMTKVKPVGGKPTTVPPPPIVSQSLTKDPLVPEAPAAIQPEASRGDVKNPAKAAPAPSEAPSISSEDIKSLDVKLDSIKNVVDHIDERVSVKEVTLKDKETGDDKKYRYDPLAPEGKQVQTSTETGLSHYASKSGGATSEESRVLGSALKPNSKATALTAKPKEEPKEKGLTESEGARMPPESTASLITPKSKDTSGKGKTGLLQTAEKNAEMVKDEKSKDIDSLGKILSIVTEVKSDTGDIKKLLSKEEKKTEEIKDELAKQEKPKKETGFALGEKEKKLTEEGDINAKIPGADAKGGGIPDIKGLGGILKFVKMITKIFDGFDIKKMLYQLIGMAVGLLVWISDTISGLIKEYIWDPLKKLIPDSVKNVWNGIVEGLKWFIDKIPLVPDWILHKVEGLLDKFKFDVGGGGSSPAGEKKPEGITENKQGEKIPAQAVPAQTPPPPPQMSGGGADKKDPADVAKSAEAKTPAPAGAPAGAPGAGKAPSAAGGGAASGGRDKAAGGQTAEAGKVPQIPDKGMVGALKQQFKDVGITNPFTQVALLANIKKESNFVPKDENLAGYAHTSNERIRKIFGSRAAQYTDAQLDDIKKDQVKMGELMYGKDTKVGKSMGNIQEGDGFKYRGRGFIQLTGKKNYEFYGKEAGVAMDRQPDIANNPNVAGKVAGSFVKTALKNKANEFTDQSAANRAVTKAIGGNLSLDSAIGQEIIGKVDKYSSEFGGDTGDTGSAGTPPPPPAKDTGGGGAPPKEEKKAEPGAAKVAAAPPPPTASPAPSPKPSDSASGAPAAPATAIAGAGPAPTAVASTVGDVGTGVSAAPAAPPRSAPSAPPAMGGLDGLLSSVGRIEKLVSRGDAGGTAAAAGGLFGGQGSRGGSRSTAPAAAMMPPSAPRVAAAPMDAAQSAAATATMAATSTPPAAPMPSAPSPTGGGKGGGGGTPPRKTGQGPEQAEMASPRNDDNAYIRAIAMDFAHPSTFTSLIRI
jgi:predicted chitinase